MIFVADENVPDPVVQALKAVRFDIQRVGERGPSPTSDREVMQTALYARAVLITLDQGIPSQAYFYQYAHQGLTVVVLRWKTSTPRDWQQMVETILRSAEEWTKVAEREPSVISVSYKRGSRARAWHDIPPSITRT